MRIGIDARSISWDGTGRYIENLLLSLMEVDGDNVYVVFGPKFEKKRIGSLSKRIEFHEVPSTYYSLKEQLLLPAYIGRKVDLMHFPNFNRPVMYRKEAVTTIHDLTGMRYGGYRKKGWLNERAYRFALKSALVNSKRLLVDSEVVRDELLDYFDVESGKIRVVSLGADHLGRVEPDSYQRSKAYVLYVGNFRPHKNIPVLMRAFEILYTRFEHDIELILCGRRDDERDSLERLAGLLGLKDRVKFIDNPGDGSLRSLYSNAEVLVQPSLMEGFGLTPLEAMREGAPVAVAGNATFKEVLGDAALFFDAKQPLDLARAMNILIRDSRIRGEFVERGLERSKDYAWQDTAMKTLAVYNEVLSE